MVGESRRVTSSQSGVHPRLIEVAERHRRHPWRRSVAEHTRRAFDRLQAVLAQKTAPLVLDAGCGTGASTLALGRRFPDSWVIGVDRSAHRLRRSGCDGLLVRDNVVLLRADLPDLWLLARTAGWRLAEHYLLYPNPWPKPAQLKRRWHAHPVFPTITALGGQLELRTNWGVYAEELSRVLGCYGLPGVVQPFHPESFASPFERKYMLSGHPLFRVRCAMDPALIREGSD